MDLLEMIKILFLAFIAVCLFGAIIIAIKAYVIMDKDGFKLYKRYQALNSFEQSQVDDILTAIEQNKKDN